jgi:hypothetical protein
LFVILQTNLPSLIVQQHDFTSLPVSVQTIFFAEAAKPIGANRKAAATNAKIPCFILLTSFVFTVQPTASTSTSHLLALRSLVSKCYGNLDDRRVFPEAPVLAGTWSGPLTAVWTALLLLDVPLSSRAQPAANPTAAITAKQRTIVFMPPI